jgi:hypothetical protein
MYACINLLSKATLWCPNVHSLLSTGYVIWLKETRTVGYGIITHSVDIHIYEEYIYIYIIHFYIRVYPQVITGGEWVDII